MDGAYRVTGRPNLREVAALLDAVERFLDRYYQAEPENPECAETVEVSEISLSATGAGWLTFE